MASQGSVHTSNTGKSGGDAIGVSGADALAVGGEGEVSGGGIVRNVDPVGTGQGFGGVAAAESFSAGYAGGGDLADNTSIGSINIS